MDANDSNIQGRNELSDCEREKMIISLLPIVKFKAMRICQIAGKYNDYQELVSAGIVGLVEAVDRFDSSKGVKIRTFVEHRIDGAIRDALRKIDHLPRGVRRKKKMLDNAQAELTSKLGRIPTVEEIINLLGLTREDYEKTVSDTSGGNIGTFSDIGNSENNEPLVRFIRDENESGNPLLVLEKKELTRIIAEEISRMNEKEAQVLSLYYKEELNMKEIGKVLDITESRVSQIHNQAVCKLKEKLKSIFKGA